jgi:hypothetical protein
VTTRYKRDKRDTPHISSSDPKDAGRNPCRLLERLAHVSEQWSVSHRVHVLSSTALASIWLRSAVLGHTANAIIAPSLFILVWLTVVAPGYLSDRLWKHLLVHLAHLSLPPLDSGSCVVVEEGSFEERRQRAASAMFQMSIALESKTGMPIAGVPMTLQKGLSIAGVLATLIAFTIKV